jgi:hypothetical protein
LYRDIDKSAANIFHNPRMKRGPEFSIFMWNAYWARGSAAKNEAVMAGPVPATPIMWHGRAKVIGVAGTSPAMTAYRLSAQISKDAAASPAGLNHRIDLNRAVRARALDARADDREVARGPPAAGLRLAIVAHAGDELRELLAYGVVLDMGCGALSGAAGGAAR